MQSNAGAITGVFQQVREISDAELATYDLAGDLLLKVAGLARPLSVELQNAVRPKNGYAHSIVDTINAELAKALDFPHWWSQDPQFELFEYALNRQAG